MRLKQQMKLLVLLSIFSVGICVSTFCLASEGENEQILFGEVEADESKDELEKVDLATASFELDTLDIFLVNSRDCLFEKVIIAPLQMVCRPERSRAPPDSRCSFC